LAQVVEGCRHESGFALVAASWKKPPKLLMAETEVQESIPAEETGADALAAGEVEASNPPVEPDAAPAVDAGVTDAASPDVAAEEVAAGDTAPLAEDGGTGEGAVGVAESAPAEQAPEEDQMAPLEEAVADSTVMPADLELEQPAVPAELGVQEVEEPPAFGADTGAVEAGTQRQAEMTGLASHDVMRHIYEDLSTHQGGVPAGNVAAAAEPAVLSVPDADATVWAAPQAVLPEAVGAAPVQALVDEDEYVYDQDEDDEAAGLAKFIDDGTLISAYVEGMKAASDLKPNYLVERCLHLAVDTRAETFYIEAPGNHPLVFTSRVDDEQMKVFARAFLAPLPYLSHLDLSYNPLGDVGVERLSRALLTKRAKNLQSLSLRGTTMGSASCNTLCQALRSCPSLLCLDVSHNVLQRSGGLELVSYLAETPTLEQIYLSDTELDIDVVVALSATLLLGHSNLRVLDLERPFITTLQEEHTARIGRMLRTNTSICEVYLGKHTMRDEGVRQLVDYLLENKTLRVLDLRCNQIGAEGAKHLGLLLRSDCRLTHLNLASNRIGERGITFGAEALANALLYNRMLTCLDLNHNMFSGEALTILGQHVDRNSTLETLAVFHNNWDQPAASEFHKILNDKARIFPLNADLVTQEVDMQIHVCLRQDFYKERR